MNKEFINRLIGSDAVMKFSFFTNWKLKIKDLTLFIIVFYHTSIHY